MIAFQLDQCLDSKRFARDCSAEGVCETVRLPPRLRDVDDPELLRTVMTSTNPLVTFDRALPHDHTSSLAEQHPGIIVISNFPAPQTMTIRIAQRVLQRFKAAFTEWPRVSWANSAVEITLVGAEVWHVVTGRLVHDAYLGFDVADWPKGLQRVLLQNTRRGSALSGSSSTSL